MNISFKYGLLTISQDFNTANYARYTGWFMSIVYSMQMTLYMLCVLSFKELSHTLKVFKQIPCIFQMLVKRDSIVRAWSLLAIHVKT